MTKLAILGGDPVRRKPFSPWPQYSATDIERLTSTVESRHWGGYPLPTALAGEFSRRFAEMQGAKYALPVANGTVAITLALQAAGVGFGDEVIVPAYTWDGTATAALAMGAVPVFADVDPDTYCLDVESVRKAITPRTKAIVPVHLAMRFADMDALLKLAAEHKILVIEDCAHAHGGAYKGKGAGSMGDIGCFSLQESKLMTSGEGGMVTTNELKYYEALQTVVNCGRASLTDQFGQRMIGLNYRMTDLQIALLVGQMERLPGLRQKRADHAALLTELLSGDPLRPLPAAAAGDHEDDSLHLRLPVPPAGRHSGSAPRPLRRRARTRRHPLRRPFLRGRLQERSVLRHSEELSTIVARPRAGDGLLEMPLPRVRAGGLRGVGLAVPVRADRRRGRRPGRRTRGRESGVSTRDSRGAAG